MSIDRPAEISSLIEKVEDVYYDSLGRGEYGSADAAENILKVVFQELLSIGVSNPETFDKVFQFYQPPPELYGE